MNHSTIKKNRTEDKKQDKISNYDKFPKIYLTTVFDIYKYFENSHSSDKIYL